MNEQEFLLGLQELHGFKITPYEANIDIGDKERFQMLKLTPEQKMQVSELLQHVPSAAAAGTMAGAYTVSFPQGMPHTLMTLKKGGFSSQIVDSANGKILGSASLYSMAAQAAVLGVFTAMSIATGQFFLMQINKELHMINKKLDEILKFLYGEKRAELLSEIAFVKYACDNYGSIMGHESQRFATIVSIQEAKKVAMKDIEFYKNDLNGKIDKIKSDNKIKDYKTLKEQIDKEVQPIKENLDISLQLYLLGGLMEVYYSRNYEKDYISQLKSDMKEYLDTCRRSIHDSYTRLKDCSVTKNKDSEERLEYQQMIEKWDLSFDKEKNTMCQNIYSVLDASTQNAEYYLKADGTVYYKVS